jgi:hypothetical protein
MPKLKRPSPAMLVALIALVTALSGSAYAALRVPQNSIGSRQLKANAVTNGKIANNAITGGKVAPESLSGADINLNALGTVPQAANAQLAAEAQKLDGHGASCPSGTTLIRGLCFDSVSNPVAHSVEEAAEACAAKGGFLPTPMQIYSARGILNLGTNLNPAQHQFTDALYGTVGSGSVTKTVVVDGVGPPEEYDAHGESAYYCVYPLVR